MELSPYFCKRKQKDLRWYLQLNWHSRLKIRVKTWVYQNLGYLLFGRYHVLKLKGFIIEDDLEFDT